MPDVHFTSMIHGNVTLADDVVIGPYCVLDGSIAPISIGSGTRLIGSAYLSGPLTIGEKNTIYPFTTLGFSPQDLKWDPARPGAGVIIGSGNTFRENVTIHRATSEDTPTRIGNENYWMATSHAGHDARVGNNCIFANSAALGGFVDVQDRVIIGGTTAIHQFCRIGRGCMLSGGVGTSMDLPPFFMLTGINVAGSINLVGLRRSNASREMIDDVKWVYKTLYRRGLPLKRALEKLKERSDRSIIQEYIEFIEHSERGICSAHSKPVRSTG